MRTQLYLWNRLRENKKKELQYIRDLYFERITPAFENAEKEADEYAQKMWDNAMSVPCYDEDYEPDFASIAEECQEAGIEKYEILSLMRYRNLSMWISCLCQVWEQQLITFVRKEMERDGYTFTRGLNFNDVKEGLEIHNHNIDKMKCWPKVKELRLAVNVIKHAEGDSADKLRKLRADYFKWPDGLNFDQDKLKHHKSSLLEETLNISNNDFEEYYEALTAFWDELPERMFSNE